LPRAWRPGRILMNTTVVVRTGWRLARRAVWSAGRLRHGLLPLVITLLMLLGFGVPSVALFGTLRQAHAPIEWSQRVLGWAFTLTVLMLTLNDLRGAVFALFLAPDLDRLRAAP